MEEDDIQIDIPSEIKTPEDARRTLVALRAVHGALKDLDARDTKVQKAVDDMMKSLQLIQAEGADAQRETVGGSERDLSRYVGGGADGEIRLLGSERSFTFAGQEFKSYEPGLLDDADSVCPWQRDFKTAVNRRNLARLTMKSPNTPRLDADVARLMARAPREVRRALESHVKRAFEGGKTRAFSNTAGAGAEWIPEQFVPDLYEAAQVRGDIRGQFQEIAVNSDSFRRPKVSNTVRPYIKGQISSDNPANYTASTPTTADQSYTVPGLAVRILVEETASEDSAVAAVPILSRLGIDGVQDGIRDCSLNGDTTASHEDAIASWNLRGRWGSTGLGGSADHRKAWKGLRRQAVDRSNTLDMGSLQTTAGMLQLMAILGERAAGNLRMFTSPEVMFQKLMGLAEVITIDKFGTRATIVNGQLADLFGVPIIPTRFMGADLAATGLYTGSGAKSGVVVVDTGAYYYYVRRSEMVEVQKIITSGHIEIVITIRIGFSTPDDDSADNVAYGFNWL